MKEIALHIMDLMENSVRAKASSIKLTIKESTTDNLYSVTIEDDGVGMSPEFVSRVTDPYTTTRTTRKVGLGLPLIKMNTEIAGGGMSIDSEVGRGTILSFWYAHDSWDRPPLGDIAGTIVMLAANNENKRIIYKHISKKGEYTFDTKEIKEILGDMSINNYDIIKYLKEMINENILDIEASK